MIAILADIHGNLPALDAVLADLPQVSQIWVLGDTVGELPCSAAVLDRLSEQPVPVLHIAGNREHSLLEAKEGLHPDWWTGTQMRPLAHAVDQLRPRHWQQLREMRPTLAVDSIPQGAVLAHGSPRATRELIHTGEQARLAVQDISQRLVACGHTHQARLFWVGEQVVVNAGSVGLSLDGIGRAACYALFDETADPRSARGVSIRYIAYDIEQTVSHIRDSGLWESAPGLARADILELQTGRHHVQSLVEFCTEYAAQQLGEQPCTVPPELWREAEMLWDGSEWLPGRSH